MRAPSARQQGRVLQRRVLAAHGIGDRLRQALRTLPLGRRAGATVAADLVDPPIDLEAVAVRIAELDGDLAAGPAAALEIDGDALGAQVIARSQHLVER